MNITMVNAPLLPVPPVLGGPIERTLYETAKAIRRPRLTVISPWAVELDTWKGLDRNIFFHVNVHQEERHVRQVFGGDLPPELQNRRGARHFYYMNGVSDLIEEIDPDVMQVHNATDVMDYLRRQFPNRGKVLYLHNEARYGDPKTAQGVGASDHLVFVSHYLARQFASHFPDCMSRSTVIYNSVDVGAFHPDLKTHRKTEKVRQKYNLKPNRTVLFVGRTVPVKGLHFLLDALFRVRKVMSGVQLLVVGSPLFGAVADSDYLRRVRRRAKALGDAVTFTGFIDPEQLPYFYAAADVSVVPSVWGEPFGKVVVEAMASGVPLIGSRRGAIPELVEDGVMGVLVDDPADVETLAQAIVDLLEDEDLRKEMAVAARDKTEREFATQIRLKRLRAFYREIG